MDLRENFCKRRNDVSMGKEERRKSWMSSIPEDRDLGFFRSIFQRCEIRYFYHNLVHVFGKTDLIFMNILQ